MLGSHPARAFRVMQTAREFQYGLGAHRELQQDHSQFR